VIKHIVIVDVWNYMITTYMCSAILFNWR